MISANPVLCVCTCWPLPCLVNVWSMTVVLLAHVSEMQCVTETQHDHTHTHTHTLLKHDKWIWTPMTQSGFQSHFLIHFFFFSLSVLLTYLPDVMSVDIWWCVFRMETISLQRAKPCPCGNLCCSTNTPNLLPTQKNQNECVGGYHDNRRCWRWTHGCTVLRWQTPLTKYILLINIIAS